MRDLSNRGAFVNILKGLIGLGILNLPYASAQVGWLPSIIGMAVVAAMTVYGIFFAVMAKHKLERNIGDKMEPTGSFGYAMDAAGRDPGSSPTPSEAADRHWGLGCFDAVVFEVLGAPGQALWIFSVLFCQYGCAIAYITVIANSAENFIEEKPTETADPHRVPVLCVIGVVLVAFSMARRLRGVAYLSLAGLLVYVFIFVALLWESATKIHQGTFNRTAKVVRHEHSGFAEWFGIVSFAFGALPVALSVYEEMNKPHDFIKVTTCTFFVCWAIYASFGVLGYLCYGDETREVVIFNFTQGSFLRYGSELTISAILLLTYVVQMMPVFSCLQVFVGTAMHWMMVRTFTVVSTVVVAYFIPDTVTIISICGAFAAAVSCFVLPPIVYMRMEPPPSTAEYLVACGLVVLGGLVLTKTFFF
mmetsp:Transcript_7543/g.21614  ORF Transcript_7543/g.21614 Transcript_7543/m.21614 type:complete len:418 (-) Transcript_7543:36-1289(-)